MNQNVTILNMFPDYVPPEEIGSVLSRAAIVAADIDPAARSVEVAAHSETYIPRRLSDKAARDILEGQVNAYDAGRFGDRYFAYVASFGAFTRSSYIVPQNIKNALGHTAYVLGGISELSQIRNEHIRMEIDGETVEDDFLFGAICNSTSIGGILTLDPSHVDMGDGKFEVMLVRMPRSLVELSECIRAVQSQDYNCEMITFRSAHHIRVEADPEMPWTLDGEKEEGHAMVEVENLHHAIHLIQRKETDA